MSRIVDVRAREILDSRGNPTVEVDVALDVGAFGRAAVPSGASTGVARGGRAARRRRARFGGKGVTEGGRERERRDRRRAARPRRAPTRRARRALIDARRHAEQGPSSAPTRSSASRSRSRSAAAAAGAAALPLPRRRGRAHAAGADDERHQRRRARRRTRRHPGVHDRARRRADVRRGGAHAAPRSYHALPKVLQGRRARDRASATRAASRPICRSNEEAIEADPRGDRNGRLQARRGRRDRARPGCRASSTRRQYYRFEGRRARLGGADGRTSTAGCVDRYPIVSIEDGLAEDDWDGWKSLTDGARRRSSSSATTSSSRTRAARSAASSAASANSILIKVNQIGTLTETLDAIEMAQRGRLHARDLASLRRDRGHHDRRPRGRAPAPARSRPARWRAPTASPSTTSSCASKRSSARGPVIRVGPRFRARVTYAEMHGCAPAAPDEDRRDARPGIGIG